MSVAGVIQRSDGSILVIKRADTGDWQLPGGVLEPTESVIDGVVREVEEETGARVEPVRLTGVYHNRTRGVLALVFACRLLDDTIRENTDEAARVDWMSPQALGRHMDEAFSVRILDAIADAPTPFVREHDGIKLLS